MVSSESIRHFVNSDALGYVAATAVGILASYFVTWLRDHQRDKRLLYSLRSGMCEEILQNLTVLDVYWDTCHDNLRGHPRGWPKDRLSTIMLERSIDPSAISVFSVGEQIQSTTAVSQCQLQNKEMNIQWGKISSGATSVDEASANMLINLQYIAQTHIDLLLQIIDTERFFYSTRLIATVEKLQPVLSKKGMRSNRTWRTSLVPETGRLCGPYLIAWRHDVEIQWPSPTKVVEIITPYWPNRTLSAPQKQWTDLLSRYTLEPHRALRLRRHIEKMREIEND